MRLQDDIDFTTLNWVKPELDETLAQARQALESYVADPGDGGLMRACAAGLHQVQGTLRMVELYGAAMVVLEMERLVAALLDGKVDQRDDAYAALMRGLVQMPDYLERLQSGHRDIPIVLLPLLNELRSSRGEPSLHESALFRPNLEAALPASAPGAPAPLPADAQKREVAALRAQFQQPLLAWFRGLDNGSSLTAMRETMDALAAQCSSVAGRRLWWITAGILDGLQRGVFEAHGAEVKQLIGKVDRSIRALIDGGEPALAEGDAEELACKLLYYAAQAQPGSDRLDAVRQTYRLEHLLPDSAEMEHARGSMAGHNRALLGTVSQAIKDDLLRVKDALDLFLRQHGGDPAQLGEQVEVLDRVADTLGMLGLNVPRRVVGEQRAIVEDIAARTHPADEDSLLDVAGALLYVEASLDDHIDRLGGEGIADADAPPALAGDSAAALPRSEARQVMEALLREAVGNIVQVKEAVVAFIESPWDHARVADVPRLLEETGGALGMLDAPRPVALLLGIGRFIDNELVVDRHIPTAEQMDKLADALASIEYYLEAAREHRGGLEYTLDVTEQSLTGLGYWPMPERRAPTAVVVEEAPGTQTEVAPGPADDLSESVSVAPGIDLSDLVVGTMAPVEASSEDMTGLRLADTEATGPSAGAAWDEVEEEVDELLPVPDAMAADAGFQGTSDEIDAEIREVFLEEVQDEIDALQGKFAHWQEQPDDNERLLPIRRAFHTLKGSGRLVGAQVLGEFSWKVESLLNRVLDGSVQPHDGVQALVRHAVDALPELLGALKGEGVPRAPLLAITEAASRLAEGQQAAVEDFAQTEMETVRRTVRWRAAGADTDGSGLPRASLAGVSAPEQAPSNQPGERLPAPVLPPMDALLVEILRGEVAQHLQVIHTSLAAADGELAIDEPLLRAVHTLHGAIAMVEIPALADVLTPLESYLKRLRALQRPLPRAGRGLLVEAAELTGQVMAQFDAAEPVLPDTAALAAQLAGLRDALPEPDLAHVVYGRTDEPQADAVVDDAAEAQDEAGAEAQDEAQDETEAAAVPAGESAHVPDDAEIAAFFAELASETARNTDTVAPETVDEAAPPEAVESIESIDSTEDLIEVEAEPDVEPEPDATSDTIEAVDEPEQPVADEPVAADIPPPPLAAAFGPLSADFSFPDDAQPDGPLELADPDPDLLAIFVEEAHDILDHADGVMAQLRGAPQTREPIVGLQRDLHTLKGGARMVALAPMGDLAHAMETLLEAVGDSRRDLDADAVESLERGFDRLHGLLQRVVGGRAVAMPQHAIAHFEALAAGASPRETARAAAARVTAPQPMPELLPEIDEDQHAPQEMIRVRADMLDSLVNYAGEVSIYRSRLEQQISGFRFNLVEFEQTVARLREQLRQLEIETEAQIIARFQREHPESEEASFDPLELDRFSQLQQYSRALAESVSDLVSLQTMLDDNTRQSETLLLQQSRVSSDLQEGLMRARMVPFESMVPTLRRTLRQAAQEVGKRAQLRVVGAHGEMDRNLLERMKAPFEHMLRNALAHGIEPADVRRAAGKPEEGTVAIDVSRDATEVVIRVSDDGAGMDRDAIRAKAIDRGLLREGVPLSDRDLFAFITESGFTTADAVTQLAGRGVGMDVVANEIKQMGGTLTIDSERGSGSTFTLRLPFTLAVTQAILIKIGEAQFAVPMTSVQGMARISHADLARRLAEPAPTFSYAGEDYAIHDLAQLLNVPAGHLADDVQPPLLLARSGDLRAAVRIDDIVGSREIVVKSVGPQISSVPGIFGATVMGDGSVLLILDLAPLVRHGVARSQRVEEAEPALAGTDAQAAPPAERRARNARPLVMVVDDSITMRKVTGRVLERNDFDVGTAKDGLDAIDKLQERVPDLMLLDIEMPRMDGYELATHMKNDPRLKDVPIIMITSRSGDKHRQRALDIGVERYLGKPYQEAELIAQIRELLSEHHG